LLGKLPQLKLLQTALTQQLGRYTQQLAADLVLGL
jgi:hypothetical protein